MASILTPNQLNECARIYFYYSQENTNFFIINCLFCNKDYSDWYQFYQHWTGQHLEGVQLNGNLMKYKECDRNEKCFKEKFKLEKLYDNQLEECETKRENIEEVISCYSEKQNNVTTDIRITQDSNCENDEEYLEEHLMEEYDKISIEVLDDTNDLSTPLSTCFFRLYSTDSKIMFKFIELLRQYPCQWDKEHFYINHKQKQMASTLHLTQQLNESLKLNITPQGTRTSVLTLIRWFDREYIRLLNCKKNNFQFVCLQSEYFEKLLEFLPHEHLKPMTCGECSKCFKSEHLLMAHKHKYHNGKVPFRCRYCGHGFIHQSSHKMHENRHIKIQVWPCKLCLYQAASKSDYIKHLATHSKRQPHKCSVCGLAYKTKSNLNVHLKSHSLPAYECEFCKKKFYEKYRYKRHIWQHEEQEVLNNSIDNFSCDICGRRFTSNKTLRRHQLVHVQENYKLEGEMSFKFCDVMVYFCDYCSLEFVQKDAFETHMNIKHTAVQIKLY